MALIHGAYTAMITPMLSNGDVDYEGFRKNVIFQLEQGIDGLLPLGTSGETPTLDEDEEECDEDPASLTSEDIKLGIVKKVSTTESVS